MIVRAWRGRAAAANPEDYVSHFREKVLPELRRVDGFIGVWLLRAPHADGVEFLILTRWRSIEAIRAFAGDEITRAVVGPGRRRRARRLRCDRDALRSAGGD
jgi:heme-degrading monooxygenase HmoA